MVLGEQAARDYQLQWGRGHVTAERKITTKAARRKVLASMGPRSCDRGKAPSQARPKASSGRFNGAAVM